MEPCFIITLHKDLELLKAIKKIFKLGTVSASGNNFACYRVRSRKDLQIIINHFNNYPLKTPKLVNFAYFCENFNLIGSKTHTNVKGLFNLLIKDTKIKKPLSSYSLDKLS